MASSCFPEPVVTNANAAVLSETNETVTAFFICLTGFSMTGAARITCNKTTSVWEGSPRCRQIERNIYVYNNTDAMDEDWWYYFLAGILSLIVLLMVIMVIWCWCWAPRSYYRKCACCAHHRQGHRQTQCSHRDMTTRRERDIFWVDTPDASSTKTSNARNNKIAKDPTRDNRVWMPHSHSVRDINTSTK